MSDLKALDVAKWFIQNKLDNPRNTYAGNMKLQKLLYFSQLIHLAKFDQPLFREEMQAYENGTVVNEVRMAYKNLPGHLIEESIKTSFCFDDEVNETLSLTVDFFGDMTASSLSDLNHELASRKVHYHSSVTETPGVYDTFHNRIDLEGELIKKDVNKIKHMLETYENDDLNSVEGFEVINGVTFYYDPAEVELTEELVSELGDMECPDDAYTLTYDKNQGIILL